MKFTRRCMDCCETFEPTEQNPRCPACSIIFNTVMNKEEKPKGGFKDDSAKPDLSLIPKEAMWEMGKALTYGAKKYSRYNFREGMDISRPISAAMRHITQFMDGEDIDEETQCIHLGNAMAGLAMAIWLLKNKPECDNRYKKDKK